MSVILDFGAYINQQICLSLDEVQARNFILERFVVDTTYYPGASCMHTT